jgi:hypothetical protein
MVFPYASTRYALNLTNSESTLNKKSTKAKPSEPSKHYLPII